MPPPPARDRFLTLLGDAVRGGTLQKLTLGKHRGADATLQNVFVRPVTLKAGAQYAFVWRHDTRDITKNFPSDAALQVLTSLIGSDFLDAHLFTAAQTAQLATAANGETRLHVRSAAPAEAAPLPASGHDRVKSHLIDPQSPWLRDLGVTNERGEPRERMADKYRQIQKFAELLHHLLTEAFPPDAPEAKPVLQLADMGSGKGYLTFALAAVLGERAQIRGIEARPELVELCNRIARDNGLAERLNFVSGTIASVPMEACDVLIALHACDTATDDAVAQGLAAGARLLVVAPCCQKELRPQLTAPPVLAGPLQHGIFQERQTEFVTDALRAQLLEWAGYRTKVFEFISTEHTAKNLMIAAIKTRPMGNANDDDAARVRALAAFYGIRRQHLAARLQFSLSLP